MRQVQVFVPLAVLCAALAGCSEASEPQVVCNELVNDAPQAGGSVVEGFDGDGDGLVDTPAATGGPIAEGTYDLVAVDYGVSITSQHWPATSVYMSSVLQIAGDSMEQVGRVSSTDFSSTSTFTTSATDLTVIRSCPKPFSTTRAYSASETELTIFEATADYVMTQTFQKR